MLFGGLSAFWVGDHGKCSFGSQGSTASPWMGSPRPPEPPLSQVPQALCQRFGSFAVPLNEVCIVVYRAGGSKVRKGDPRALVSSKLLVLPHMIISIIL